MASYLFRIGDQGVDELRKKLEALGPAGTKAFDAIASASPRLANALGLAEERAERARREMEALQRQSDKTAGSMGALGRAGASLAQSMQGVGTGLGAVGSAMAAMGPVGIVVSTALALATAGVTKFYAATGEAERASLRLDAVLKATGNTAGLSRGQIDKMAESFQAAFHIDDDDIRQAAGTLATFKSVAGDAFQETIKQALNMRAVFGGDLQSSIIQLGKALESPTIGLTALRRSGVSFSDSQKDLIASLEKAGDRAAAQAIILHELETQIGGTAAAQAGGLTGAVDRLSVAWGNFWETAPERLGPVKDLLEILARGIERVTKDLAGPTLQDKQASQWAELNALLDKRKAVDDSPLLDPFGTERDDLDKQIQAKNAELTATRALIQAAADKEKADQAAAKAAAERHEKEVKAEAEQAAAAAARKIAEKEAERAAKAAADEAERSAKARKKATEDATVALQDQVAGLREETYELGLSDKERFIRQQVLKAEQTVLKGVVEDGEEYIAQVEREAAANYDATKAVKDKKDAETAAAKQRETQAKDQQKIAEREAELRLEPYKNAIQGIQSAWTDGWKSVFSGDALDSAASLFDQLKQVAIQTAAEVMSYWTFKPFNDLASGVANGPGGQSLLQNAAGGGGIGSLLFGTAGGNHISATSGLLGYGGGGQFREFLNSGVGTGVVAAAVAAGASAAAGSSAMQTIFSSGGALLGGIAGSYFGSPAAGAAVGGIAGHLLAGLFGGSGKKKAPKIQSLTGIDALASGIFGVGSTLTNHSGDVTSGLGGNAVNALNAFLGSIGGSLSGAIPGQNSLEFFGRTPRYKSTVGGVTNKFGNDAQAAQDAVADFMARTMVEAAKSDKLDGVSAAVKTAIANSGATDAAALDAAVAFGKFYDRVDKIRTPAQSAAAALTDLAAQMAKATGEAEKYGLAAAKLPEIFRQNFTDDIADQLLQLKDPAAYALKQLEIEKAAAIAQATQLGADLNAVEELYGLKRQQVVAQGLQGLTSSFQAFFNALLTDSNLSALSPQEQYKVTKAAFEGASNDNVIGAVTPFLNASRGVYASSTAYANDYRAALERVKAAGGLTTDIPAFAAGGDHAGGTMLVGENGPELIATGAARVFDAETTAAIMSAANADLSPKTLAAITKSFGRQSDTELVHMRPDELQTLITWWGGSTINPSTGLREFLLGSTGGGAYGSGTNRSSGGWGGGAHGRQSESHTDNHAMPKSALQATMGAAAAHALSKGKSQAGNATVADYEMAKKYGLTPKQYQDAYTELGNKISDAYGTGDNVVDKILNLVAGIFGSYEVNPVSSPEELDKAWKDALDDAKNGITRPADQSAERRLDLFSIAASIAGFFAPGVGMAYGLGTTALGHPNVGQLSTGPSGIFGPGGILGPPDRSTSSSVPTGSSTPAVSPSTHAGIQNAVAALGGGNIQLGGQTINATPDPTRSAGGTVLGSPPAFSAPSSVTSPAGSGGVVDLVKTMKIIFDDNTRANAAMVAQLQALRVQTEAMAQKLDAISQQNVFTNASVRYQRQAKSL